MRIAIMGIRGVPANYGGFETFAEQLGARLVERGHEVTVYGRTSSVPPTVREYRGMRVVRLPAPRSKYLETVVHTLVCALHATFRRFEIVYVCNSANVPAVVWLIAAQKRVVLNVDGLEWQRAKWNGLGKAYYRACAWLAAHLPVHIVTDAKVIQAYYERAYCRSTDYFPYGTEVGEAADEGTLQRLDVAPRRYVLYVSRLEPENNAHAVIGAFSHVVTDLPLLIVGDAPYASEYIRALKRTRDSRVRFPGAIYGQGYRVLQSNAAVYIQATEVGGTHPALVEAMGAGCAIVANDVPEHREVLGDAGWYFRGDAALASNLQRLLDDPGSATKLRAAAKHRAESHFSWQRIADAYERWFGEIASPRRSRHRSAK